MTLRNWLPFLILIAIAQIVGLVRWLRRKRLMKISAKWPTARGHLLQATVEELPGADASLSKFRIRVIYSYPAGEPPPYTGEFTEIWGSREEAQGAIHNLERGHFLVRHHPTEVAKSVLDRT
jgi:hypothetical protein